LGPKTGPPDVLIAVCPGVQPTGHAPASPPVPIPLPRRWSTRSSRRRRSLRARSTRSSAPSVCPRGSCMGPRGPLTSNAPHTIVFLSANPTEYVRLLYHQLLACSASNMIPEGRLATQNNRLPVQSGRTCPCHAFARILTCLPDNHMPHYERKFKDTSRIQIIFVSVPKINIRATFFRPAGSCTTGPTWVCVGPTPLSVLSY